MEELKTLKKRDIYSVNYKIFIRFKKEGISSLLGMHDLSRIMISALKIAGAKISLSKGFHPLEKVSFTPPTPFACESEAEYMEVGLTDNIDIDLLKNKINNLFLHIGINILKIEFSPINIKKINSLPKNILYQIETDNDKKAFNFLKDKDALKISEERNGDYLIIMSGNKILLTLLDCKEKMIRPRDIKNYLLKNNIVVEKFKKLDLVEV